MQDCDECDRFLETKNEADQLRASAIALRKRLDDCAAQNGYMQLALVTIADGLVDADTARKIAADGLVNRRLSFGGAQ